jgi:hypothetical protein
MAITNLQSASEALKLFYIDGFRYQLNNAAPLLAIMEKDSESVVGSEVRMALRYGRQGGIGNRSDDGDLPTPRSRQTKQAAWQTKNLFAQIQITDKTMKASRGAGGFESLLEAELSDALEDAKDDVERQLFGSQSGKMAITAVNTAVNLLLVDTVQYFAEGQIVDVVDPATGTVKAQAREITIVDPDAKTITVTGAAVTTAATDIIVRSGNYGLEMTGLESIFTKDNVLYGINRAQNKWFNPTLIPTVGTISEVKIQNAIDEVDRKAAGRVNVMSASHGVRRAYQELLLATKRTTDTMKLKGGYTALLYNDTPITVSKYNPAGNLYGLDMSTFKMYEMGDWDWLDEDGAVLSRVPNKAAWGAVMAHYADIGVSKPAGSFLMSGITEK